MAYPPFKDEVFDAVVSVGAVEYFPDPERALREMARIVKHDGRVVVGGPEFGWFRKVMLHRLFYSPDASAFESMFCRAGLRDLKRVLTGVDTVFGTGKYFLITAGTKK